MSFLLISILGWMMSHWTLIALSKLKLYDTLKPCMDNGKICTTVTPHWHIIPPHTADDDG